MTHDSDVRPLSAAPKPPPSEAPDAPAAGSLGEKAVTSALLLALLSLGARGISFISTAVLAHLLVPKQFGILALGLTIVSFGSFLVDVGLGAVLIRGEQDPDRGTLSSVLGFQLLAMMLVIAVMAALSIVFGTIMLLAALMAAGLVVAGLRVPSVIVLERQLKYGLIASAGVADTCSSAIFSIALVIAGLGVWGVAISATIQGVLGTTLILRRGPLGYIRPTLSFSRVRPLLSFGLQYQGISLVNLIRDEVLNVVIVAIAGFGVLGIVTLANRLMVALTLVFDAIWRVSFPAMAQALRTGADRQRALDKVARYSGLGAAVILVAVAGFLPGSVTIVFGAKWTSVLVVLPGMLGGLFVVGPISVACAGYLLAEGRVSVVLKSAIAHTVVAWISVVALLPSLGLPLISYSAFVVCIVEAIVLGVATHQTSGWNAGVALSRIWLIGGSLAIVTWEVGKRDAHGLLLSAALSIGAEAVLIVLLLLIERRTLVGLASLVFTRVGSLARQLRPEASP